MGIVMLMHMIQYRLVNVELWTFAIIDGMYRALIAELILEYRF